MTHDGDNGCPGQEIFRSIFFFGFSQGLYIFNAHKFNGIAKLISYHHDGFRIEALVDRNKQSKRKAGGNNLGYRHIHQIGEFVGRYEFCHCDCFQILFTFDGFFCHHLAGNASFFAAMFRSFGFSSRTESLKGLFNLFLDIFGRKFSFGNIAACPLLIA